MSALPTTVEHHNFPVMAGAVAVGSAAVLMSRPPSQMTFGDLAFIAFGTLTGALVGNQIQKYRERHAPQT